MIHVIKAYKECLEIITLTNGFLLKNMVYVLVKKTIRVIFYNYNHNLTLSSLHTNS